MDHGSRPRIEAPMATAGLKAAPDLADGECASKDREPNSETEESSPVRRVGRGHVQHDVHQRKREKELRQKRPKYGRN